MRFRSTLAAAAAALFMAGSASGGAAGLPPIREVVSFGDSLTDAGTYWFRFTTNPGLTFAQLLALQYGQLPLPNQHLDDYANAYQGDHGSSGPGGLNYAEGGAKANSAYSIVSQDPEGKPISTVVQLKHFLAQHQKFAPDQLVTLYVGTNDVAFHYDVNVDPKLGKQLRDDRPASPETMRAETARVQMAADDVARTAQDILAHGAKRLLVFKLVDMGDLPWFHTRSAQTFVRTLSRAFNDRLQSRLPEEPGHLLLIDTQALVNDMIRDAADNGLKHGAHEDACRQDDQDYCFPGTMKSKDADRTYVFAAGEHLTTRANQLLADAVLRQVEASPLK